MASDFAAERSPEARALAEEALLRLLLALEGQHAEVVVLVVLGGLVPEILTRGQAESVARHLGTTDVDIHVSFVTEPDHDLSSLEAALEEAGFEPDARHGGGWRWRIRIGDVPIKVVGDTREEVEQLIRDAISLHLDGLRQSGDPVPEPTAVGTTLVQVPAA